MNGDAFHQFYLQGLGKGTRRMLRPALPAITRLQFETTQRCVNPPSNPEPS